MIRVRGWVSAQVELRGGYLSKVFDRRRQNHFQPENGFLDRMIGGNTKQGVLFLQLDWENGFPF